MSGGGGGGGAPAPKNPWDNLGVNTQQGYGTLQSGFNPGANIQQQGASYAQLRNQGFTDDAIRSSVQSVYGQQPQDWYAVRRAGGPYEGLGVNTQQGFNTLVGATGQGAVGQGAAYNSLLRQGFGNETIRSSANELFGNQSDADWNDMVTQAGLAAGRPLPGSAQFYQPVYQQQYTNYTTTNPLGVSQYNQPMTAQSLVDSAYAGIGRYGSGNNVDQVDPAGRQYWNNQLNSGALNPGNFFGTFTNAVSEFGRQNPTNAYSQYVANQPGYSGGFQNFAPVGNPYQMTTPFNPYTNSFQSPFSYMQQPQTNYGPAQQIVSRSAAARGTPNVMRRAEGGIASLVGDE